MSEQEKVGPGKLVKYSYVLTDAADGKVLFEAKPDAPDVLIYGISLDVLPGLIEALKDLKAGDGFGVTLPPEAAFGPAYPENILTLDKSIFLNDKGEIPAEITVGAMVPMLTQEGQRVMGVVKEIQPDKVVMDFNHPFAGKTVEFNGRVEEVRDPSEDEIKMMQGGGCGCGCHGGDCGDGCGDHGCDGDHHHGCGDHGCGCH